MTLWLKMILLTTILGCILSMFMAYRVRAESYLITTEMCDDTPTVEADLKDKFKEKEFAAGITSGGRLMKLFKSETTWTLVEEQTIGMACVVRIGAEWQQGKEGTL